MSISNNYCFPAMRDIQVKVLNEIEEAYKSYDYILCEIPTGGGKSGIVSTTALWLGESYISTSSILLQEQYLNDFPFMHTIKGKSNFECIDPMTQNIEKQKNEILFVKGIPFKDSKKLTCDQGRCMFDKKYHCELKPKKNDYVVMNRGLGLREKVILAELGKTPCHYYDQKLQGMLGGHTIMNYKYLLSMFFYAPQELASRKFLALDECHALENESVEFIKLNISRHFYEQMSSEIMADPDLKKLVDKTPFPKSRLDDIDTWTNYLQQTVEWMDRAKAFYTNLYSDDKLDKRGTDNMTKIEDLISKIGTTLYNINQDKSNWIVSIKYEFDRMKVRDVHLVPIETGRYIKPLFDIADKKMFVSATILDKDVYSSMIGVKPEEIKFIRVNESPFPVKNRTIQALNIGEINYRTTNALLPLIALNIDSILNNHPDQKGLIHTTNYSTVDYILKNISENNRKRLLITGGDIPQTEILRRHVEGKNTVLLSPSLYQGIDLKYDLARFQIIIKTPYPDISDQRTAVKMKKDYKWYQWQTALRLVQSYGRIVRSETDYGVTYVLDSNIKKFMNNRMIPNWFKEAVIMR